jgi:hypothetical protein
MKQLIQMTAVALIAVGNLQAQDADDMSYWHQRAEEKRELERRLEQIEYRQRQLEYEQRKAEYEKYQEDKERARARGEIVLD